MMPGVRKDKKETPMKRSTRKVAWLVLLAMVAFRQPLVAGTQNHPDDTKDSSVAAQSAPGIKWTFGGSDAGNSTYQIHPDGKFESVTELNIAGVTLKSRLTG